MALVQRLGGDLNRGQLELPSFPHVVVRIREVLSDEDASLDDVARVVGSPTCARRSCAWAPT